MLHESTTISNKHPQIKITSVLFQKTSPILYQSLFYPSKQKQFQSQNNKIKQNKFSDQNIILQKSHTVQSRINSNFYLINRMLKWNHFKHKQQYWNKNKINPPKQSINKFMSFRAEQDKITTKKRVDSFKFNRLSQSPMSRTTRYFNSHAPSSKLQQNYKATRRVILLQQAQQKKTKQCKYKYNMRYKTQIKPQIFIINNHSIKINPSPDCRPWSGASMNHSGCIIKSNNSGTVACRFK